MDFDEYEYLENTVENPEKKTLKGKVNGSGIIVETDEKDKSWSSKDRNDYERDDSRRPSKHSRSEKEEDSKRFRDGGSHHGPSSKDKDDKKEKRRRELRNREREEGSVRERNSYRDHDIDKERGREKEKNRNHSGRERDHEYERGTDREGEPERLRQSRSHSERSKDGGSTDKDYKERRGEREFRDRDRKHQEKKEAQAEADPERDQRTVFAYQVSLKASEKDVYEFFSNAGKVRDVQIIMDRNSRRSKGFGYIEFYDAMSVPMAIALSGQPLLGQAVMVKPSEAEKNLVQSTSVASGGTGVIVPYSGGARRLYVGNLPVTMKEDQLRMVFEPFGTVELVQMPIDLGTGNCKGYAFVQFSRLEDAQAAHNLNGQLEIAGRVIKVSAVTDQGGTPNAGANIIDFDDDEGSGLSLNAQSRALLMQKLDRTGSSSSPGTSFPTLPGQTSTPLLPGLSTAALPIPASAGPYIDTIGVPSECLLLKNMFDPNTEVEPDFDLDVKEDVQDECSKFGKLKHIFVDKTSAGCVYLRFENAESSTAAQRALHGRWFAGKMITASYILPHDYSAKFPDNS